MKLFEQTQPHGPLKFRDVLVLAFLGSPWKRQWFGLKAVRRFTGLLYERPEEVVCGHRAVVKGGVLLEGLAGADRVMAASIRTSLQ